MLVLVLVVRSLLLFHVSVPDKPFLPYTVVTFRLFPAHMSTGAHFFSFLLLRVSRAASTAS